MANTYTLINSHTISNSNTTSVTFSSIPQIYETLIICASTYIGTGYYNFNSFLQINNLSNVANYIGRAALNEVGDPNILSTTSSTSSVAGFISTGSASPSNNFSNNWSMLSGYTNATYPIARPYFGTAAVNSNSPLVFGQAHPNQNEAITSLTFKNLANAIINEGSTFYLYGITNN